MGVREQFWPRDQHSAARSAAAFSLAGALLLVTLTLVSPDFAPNQVGRVSTLVIALALAALAAVELRAPERVPLEFYAFVPTLVLVLAVYLDLVTQDASAAGQIFLTWPVLFAAYELRPLAAGVVLVQVLVADAVIVFSLLPIGDAVTDLVCVGTTLAIFCLLLVRAREREERLVAELQRQVAVDPLTGLATRRVLDDAVRTALATGARDTALLLLDVDDFKLVNDELGHPAGDAVLQHVAALLIQQFAPGALVARLGGDELAVLLHACDATVAAQAAEAFCRRLRNEPAQVAAGPVRVTVSVGASSTEGRALPPGALYSEADQALYAAKRGGRDQVRSAGERSAEPTTTSSAGGRRRHRA